MFNMMVKINKKSSVLKIANPNRGNFHPTQKPLELGRYLVRTYTNKDDLVLDNACGSGTFLVAAKLEGRGFIIRAVKLLPSGGRYKARMIKYPHLSI